MTDEDFRTLALGLPETSEGKHEGRPTSLVRGRRFATLGWPAPHNVGIGLNMGELDLLLAAAPLAIERARGVWSQRGHAHLNLATVDDSTVRSVLIMARRRSAPARLARSFEP
jgi:hypothetical protein